MGIAYWQEAFKEYKTVPKVKIDAVEASETYVKGFVIAVVCIASVLDILACKYKWLRGWLIYVEMMMMIVHSFVPYNNGTMTILFDIYWITYLMFWQSVDVGPNAIVATLTSFIVFFVTRPYMFEDELTLSACFNKTVAVLTVFVMSSIFGMFITYTSQIRLKLSTYHNSNLSLLNRMQEGLVVLTDDKKEVQFANNTAISLIKQLFQREKGNQSEHDQSNLEPLNEQDLNRKIFTPSKASLMEAEGLHDALQHANQT